MKFRLFVIFFIGCCIHGYSQPSDTYIVADNTHHLFSCEDSLLTLESIYYKAGIRDLNDPQATVDDFILRRVDGSMILEELIEPIRYSEHDQVFVQRKEPTNNHLAGVSIFLRLVELPERLFMTDTLKYVVDRGEKISFSRDFIVNFDFETIGYTSPGLLENISITDESVGEEWPIADHWIVGPGTYKIKAFADVCGANRILWDSLYVSVIESNCSKIEIRNLPGYCEGNTMDITPYIYVEGELATSEQLAQMSFWDRSGMTLIPAYREPIDPTAIALNTEGIFRFPLIEIAYQPNVVQGVCENYFYRLTYPAPSKLPISGDTVFTRNNAGTLSTYTIDGAYYGFNNSFDPGLFKRLYIDPYDIYEGTEFKFYTDQTLNNEVNAASLQVGQYFLHAENLECQVGNSTFWIDIKERDFEIIWQSAQNSGQGYHTFLAPEYQGATYRWIVYGGSTVAGQNTRELQVYFSENISRAVSVRCEITLPALRTTAGNVLNSAIYIAEDDVITGGLTDLQGEVEQLYAFPNPAQGTFAIQGAGIYELKLYSMQGNLVHYDAAYSANTPVRTELKGLFIAQLKQGEKTEQVKVNLY